MTNFVPMKHPKGANVQKDYSSTYEWHKVLKAAEDKTAESMIKHFAPVSAFANNLIQNFTEIVRPDILIELSVNEYKKDVDKIHVRWFAKILKVAGYRLYCQWAGAADADYENNFWVNALTAEIYSVGHLMEVDPDFEKSTYSPPPFLYLRHKEEFDSFVESTVESLAQPPALIDTYDSLKKNLYKSKFKIGDRVELLDYNNSRRLRPARVQNVCGRRLCVAVTKSDYDGEWDEDDRQLHNNAEFWIDEESFFIFPVGWGITNGYEVAAKKDYLRHIKGIALDIENGKKPSYSSIDVQPGHFGRAAPEKEFEVGQKLEIIDPLAQTFQEFKVATVLKVLKDGYICVGMDGPDIEEDSIPLYSDSPFLFPVGYADTYGITLTPPDDVDDFSWKSYLKMKKAQAAPAELFRSMPSEERAKKFRPGIKLEAADMCENQLICPATVIAVKGRILHVHFDGWEDEYDEFYDFDSHDIFPVGWCEIHGYKLQYPKGDPEEPEKKKRKR